MARIINIKKTDNVTVTVKRSAVGLRRHFGFKPGERYQATKVETTYQEDSLLHPSVERKTFVDVSFTVNGMNYQGDDFEIVSSKRITALQVACPTCGRRPGRACKGSRIPSASSFGGGWGGPADLKRPHKERVELAKERTAELG